MAVRCHLRYARYLFVHKWWVFLAACRLGVPWLGLIHDLSKFWPSQWVPYVNHFYRRPCPRDASGYIKTADTGDKEFDWAWRRHVYTSPHHWQFWCDTIDSAAPMPDRYRREMLADWIGAGRAQHAPDTLAWYTAHRNQIVLHPETRAWVENQLSYRGEDRE